MSVKTGRFFWSPLCKGGRRVKRARGIWFLLFLWLLSSWIYFRISFPVIPGLTRDPGFCGSRHRERSAAIFSFPSLHRLPRNQRFLAMTDLLSSRTWCGIQVPMVSVVSVILNSFQDLPVFFPFPMRKYWNARENQKSQKNIWQNPYKCATLYL